MSSPDDPDLRDLPEDDDAFDPGPVPLGARILYQLCGWTLRTQGRIVAP